MKLIYNEEMTQTEAHERKKILDDYFKTDFKISAKLNYITFEDVY